MAYELFHGDKQRVEDRLNGTITLGPFPKSGLPVGGLTLIFAAPAVTVTFTGSGGSIRTFDEIVTQLRADLPTVTVRTRTGSGPNQSGAGPGVVTGPRMMIALQLDTGITIDKDGTANPVFGIEIAADSVGRAAVTSTDIIGFSQGSAPGMYAVLIDLP